MVKGPGPFQSAPRFEGSRGTGDEESQGSGEQDPQRVPGMEKPEPITDAEHHCKGSVKKYDYGTAYCDPDKGGCGKSQGVDLLWRS